MSKEIKEKCKMCRYYNDKQQYPNVEGQTTHSNCISIKCQYRKITKDMQIRKLTHENKILSKALELACKKLYSEMDNPMSEIYYYMADEMPDYFKQQAQKELKDE